MDEDMREPTEEMEEAGQMKTSTATVIALTAAILLSGCADLPPPTPTKGDYTSDVPVNIHWFYDRPSLIAYCVDTHSVMLPRYGRTAVACAKAHYASCDVAVMKPNSHISSEQVFAVCNNFIPMF